MTKCTYYAIICRDEIRRYRLVQRTEKIIKYIKIMSILVVMVLGITACSEDENDKYMDLNSYFGLEEVAGGNYCAIIIDNQITGKGVLKDDAIYIPYSIVRSTINNKFYVDKKEQLLIYTTPNEIFESKINSDNKDNKGTLTEKGVISLVQNEEIFVNLDYILKMGSNIKYNIYENPDRIVIRTILNNTVVDVKDDEKIRFEANPNAEILVDVESNQKLYLIEEDGTYSKVADETGVVGYIKTEVLGEKEERLDTTEYKPNVYSHITRDKKICLAWQQMESESGNGALEDYVLETTGINVISPTWYQLINAKGEISSCASADYVKRAHNYGMEVWALVSDFNYDEANNMYYVNEVLSSTKSRRKLINLLLKEVEATGMDGINIDFEKITSEYSEDYVEFIRELSIECRKRGIVLSVDMYVPIESNRFYDRTSVGEAADYVIVMGYDEHWGGCKVAGSTASIGFVTAGIKDTIAEVEASRVINAIPFYTRVWVETPEELADPDDEIIEDSVLGNYTLSSFAVGMGTAKRYLDENGVEPMWMDELGQYYGEYKVDGITYRIWVEDHDSIKLKLDVMKEHNIGGVACWKLGLEINDIWTTISEYTQSN